MKKLLATAFLTIWSFCLFSQKSPFEFGKIPMEDLQMETYGLDSSASAVVLFNYGETVLVPGEYYYFCHSRIKILKKEGYRWGDISLAIFGSVKYSIDNFKASTFNLVDGKVVETSLERTGKFTEEIVDGVEALRFAMSNVKEGSVIEFTYKIKQGIIQDWEFQNLIPTRFSQYKIFISPLIKFNMSMQGYLSPTVYQKDEAFKSSQKCIMQNWVMENIPAFKPEPQVSSHKNYIAKLNFDLSEITTWFGSQIDVLNSWDKLKENYRYTQYNGKVIKNSAFLRSITNDVTASCETQDEKVLAIFNHTKKHFEWNGRHRVLTDESGPRKAYDARQGSSADINLTMLAMLMHAGLKAEPVLISTRDHGFVRTNVPNSKQFNKVIVWTEYEGKSILLDATDKNLPHNFLPENCLNGLGSGYRVGETTYQWLSLTDLNKTKTIINAKLEVKEDGSLAGNVSMRKNGYAARDVRQKLSDSDKKEDYLKNVITHPSVEFSNNTFQEADSMQSLLQESHEFTMSEYCQVTGAAILFNPTIVSRIDDNPFKSETREYPVDFHFPVEITYSARITIPANYEVDEVPEKALIILPESGGKFLFNCVKGANEITITSQLILNRSFFSQLEYPVLREFYNIMTAKQAEQIVLKKKT